MNNIQWLRHISCGNRLRYSNAALPSYKCMSANEPTALVIEYLSSDTNQVSIKNRIKSAIPIKSDNVLGIIVDYYDWKSSYIDEESRLQNSVMYADCLEVHFRSDIPVECRKYTEEECFKFCEMASEFWLQVAGLKPETITVPMAYAQFMKLANAPYLEEVLGDLFYTVMTNASNKLFEITHELLKAMVTAEHAKGGRGKEDLQKRLVCLEKLVNIIQAYPQKFIAKMAEEAAHELFKGIKETLYRAKKEQAELVKKAKDDGVVVSNPESILMEKFGEEFQRMMKEIQEITFPKDLKTSFALAMLNNFGTPALKDFWVNFPASIPKTPGAINGLIDHLEKAYGWRIQDGINMLTKQFEKLLFQINNPEDLLNLLVPVLMQTALFGVGGREKFERWEKDKIDETTFRALVKKEEEIRAVLREKLTVAEKRLKQINEELAKRQERGQALEKAAQQAASNAIENFRLVLLSEGFKPGQQGPSLHEFFAKDPMLQKALQVINGQYLNNMQAAFKERGSDGGFLEDCPIVEQAIKHNGLSILKIFQEELSKVPEKEVRQWLEKQPLGKALLKAYRNEEETLLKHFLSLKTDGDLSPVMKSLFPFFQRIGLKEFSEGKIDSPLFKTIMTLLEKEQMVHIVQSKIYPIQTSKGVRYAITIPVPVPMLEALPGVTEEVLKNEQELRVRLQKERDQSVEVSKKFNAETQDFNDNVLQKIRDEVAKLKTEFNRHWTLCLLPEAVKGKLSPDQLLDIVSKDPVLSRIKVQYLDEWTVYLREELQSKLDSLEEAERPYLFGEALFKKSVSYLVQLQNDIKGQKTDEVRAILAARDLWAVSNCFASIEAFQKEFADLDQEGLVKFLKNTDALQNELKDKIIVSLNFQQLLDLIVQDPFLMPLLPKEELEKPLQSFKQLFLNEVFQVGKRLALRMPTNIHIEIPKIKLDPKDVQGVKFSSAFEIDPLNIDTSHIGIQAFMVVANKVLLASNEEIDGIASTQMNKLFLEEFQQQKKYLGHEAAKKKLGPAKELMENFRDGLLFTLIAGLKEHVPSRIPFMKATSHFHKPFKEILLRGVMQTAVKLVNDILDQRKNPDLIKLAFILSSTIVNSSESMTRQFKGLK